MTFYKQLRAYVTFNDITISELSIHTLPLDHWNISVSLINQGQTPAVNIYSNTNYCAYTQELNDAFEFPDNENHPAELCIASKSVITLPSVHIPTSIIKKMLDGSLLIYVWG